MDAFAAGEDPAGTGYWRWLAPAWSGKTALMAQFALRGREGVDVIAFFITARMAGRSDRTAFLTTVQNQLRAYLQDGDVDCTGYGGFSDALNRAARQARSHGRRLVLMIDGMDEDSGVESAASGYSIAGLLPRTLPDGLHVIVAGRPNPPVPSDVAPDHPLRSPTISHRLADSAAARAVRADAERSLEALNAAGGISLDLVGLTAAAGGGLSAADLSLLTKEYTARRIEVVLGGATGRSFQLRPAQWATTHDGSPVPLYSFAHQELLSGARQLLPVPLLDGYRDRVHEFAEIYRKKGWPADTPEYMLTGYPQMVREQRDAPRLTALATDSARHERLWQTTGTDTRALTEIGDAFTLHLASTEPDLRSCVQLAHCRDGLEQKVLNVPEAAIRAWARAGYIRKAVALAAARAEFSAHGSGFGDILREALKAAESGMVMEAVHAIPENRGRDSVLRDCVAVFAKENHLREAADAARALTDHHARAQALTEVAEALVKAGESDQGAELAQAAAEIFRTIADPGYRAEGMACATAAIAKAGRKDRAGELARAAVEAARAVGDPEDRVNALVSAAVALAQAGETEEAVELARAAADIARALGEPEEQASALGEAAKGLLVLNRTDEAARLPRLIAAPGLRCTELLDLARFLVTEGRADEAADFARLLAEAVGAMTDAEQRVPTLAAAAGVLARAGKADEASELAREAIGLARTTIDADGRVPALEGVARLLAVTGEAENAAHLAHAITDPRSRATALTAVVREQATAGKTDEAARLARTIVDPGQRALALSAVAVALADAGESARGRELAQAAAEAVRSVNVSERRAGALAQVAEAFAKAGEPQQAAHRAQEAAEAARATTDPDWHATVLTRVARALAGVGRADEAAELAHGAARVLTTSEDPRDRAFGVAQAAEVLARAGRNEQAVELARIAVEAACAGERYLHTAGLMAVVQALLVAERTDEAGRVARTIADADHRTSALAIVVASLTEAGETERGMELAQAAAESARTVTGPEARSGALVQAAEAIAKAGGTDQAAELLRAAAEAARTVTAADERARAMAGVATSLVKTGETEQAVQLAEAAAEVARGATNPRWRAWALREVAQALMMAGRADQAIRLAHTITEPNDRASALADAAHTLAITGQADRAAEVARAAAETARATGSPQRRAMALLAVVHALVAAGRADEAGKIAYAIVESKPRAAALSGIARHCAGTPRGRELLAWSLSLESLSSLAEEVALLAPDVLDEMVRCTRQSLGGAQP
ncbi:hypothetical protein [Streptomyces sp. cmx-18-6]|uniref:hypothetical protein n=1 Tax=Streptomyces sp. cmx-18-6 TaxID=2790930 RepID=UPI00397EDC1D